MAETKPSPMGRRVLPVIDATMRAKVEAAAAKKRKDQVCYLLLSSICFAEMSSLYLFVCVQFSGICSSMMAFSTNHLLAHSAA